MARKGVTTISNQAVIAGWTADKLLKGAGAGADPTEVDPITYEELESASGEVSVIDTWEDWDISGIVPVGTKAAEVRITVPANTRRGIRADGSALDRNVLTDSSGAENWTVKVGISRVVEIYSSDLNAGFRVVGYWI